MIDEQTLLRCRGCKELKPAAAFNRQTKSRTGRQAECKICARARINAWYAGLSPEEKKARVRGRGEHRRANPEMYYWHRLKSVYGLTRAAFESLLTAQDGTCAICKAADPGGRSGRWCVDHDHTCCAGDKSCGRCVRGLLCGACNHGLGNFRDNPESLRRAADYLERSTP